MLNMSILAEIANSTQAGTIDLLPDSCRRLI
jgi:hypothetical protein